MIERYLNLTTYIFVIVTFAFLAYRLYELFRPSKKFSERPYDKLNDKYNMMLVEDKTETEASTFFNLENIFKCHGISFGLVKSISGLLVGLGILGTFVGLALGVYKLNLGHGGNSISVEDLQPLMNGMKTSFVSSIVGMFCSIVYTVISKTFLSNLQSSLNDYCFELDTKHYATSTYYLRLQRDAQKIASDTITSKIESIETRISSMGGQLGEQITAALGDKLNGIANTLENVGNTAETLQKTSDNISSLLTTFKESITKLNEASGEFEKTFAKNTQRFEELSSSIKSIKDVMDEKLPRITSDLEKSSKSHENTSNTLNTTVENLSSVISKLPDTNQLATDLANITENTQAAVDKVNGTLSKAVDNIAQKLSGLNNIGDNLNKALGGINESAESIGKTFKTIESSSTTLTSSINSILENIEPSVGSMGDVATKLNDTVNTLETTIESVSQVSKKMEETTQKQIDLLNDQIKNLPKIKDDFQKVVGEFEKGIGTYTESVQKNLNTIIGNFVAGVEKACSSIDTTANKVHDAFDELTKASSNIKNGNQSNK